MTEELPPDIDENGKCIRHPQIHLRRQLSSGGWRNVLSNCPLCAISPPRPVKSRVSERRRTLTSLSSPSIEASSTPRSSSSSSQRDSGDSISRFMSGCEKDFSNFSISTDTTVASLTSASSGSSTSEDQPERASYFSSSSSIRSSALSPASSSSRLPSKKSVVCGMRYLCPDRNRLGSYTGQLHPETQVPHGVGCLRYRDGSLADGDWSHGRLITTSSNSKQQQEPICELPPMPLHRRDRANSLEGDDYDDDNNSLGGSIGDNSAFSSDTRYTAREVKSELPTRSSSSSSPFSLRRKSESCRTESPSLAQRTEGRRTYMESKPSSYLDLSRVEE